MLIWKRLNLDDPLFMNRKLSLVSTLILLIGIITFSNAQDFRMGIKGGGNLSTLGVEEAADVNQTRSGYHVGFSFSWDLLNFGLQPELLYSTQGAEVALPGLVYEEQYDYLNLPVTLKFYTGKGFNVHFGPYFAILVNATQRENPGNIENDISDFIANTDYGAFAGVGYDLEMGLNFELRYNYGLTDVDSQQNIERRNRVFQISATYFFVK